MKCRYCGAQNDALDHRCCRCGRRLHLANPRPAERGYPITTATAPDVAGPRPVETPVITAEADRRPRRPRQGVLFETENGPKVIPFDPGMAVRTGRSKPAAGRQRGDKQESRQESLGFMKSERFGGSEGDRGAESSIYCNAPVASLSHRLLAFFIDFLIVMAAVGVFGLTLYVSGAFVPVLQAGSALAWWTLAGFGGLLYFLYEFIWAAAKGETFGMSWTRLRLLHFDGREPDFRDRLIRLASLVLSIMPAGLGLIWALGDGEKLAWHDHISNTFLTPLDYRR